MSQLDDVQQWAELARLFGYFQYQEGFAVRHLIDEFPIVQQLTESIHKKHLTVYSDLTERPESLSLVFCATQESSPLFINTRALAHTSRALSHLLPYRSAKRKPRRLSNTLRVVALIAVCIAVIKVLPVSPYQGVNSVSWLVLE